MLCICWDTLSKKTGVWQLPIVYSAFKGQLNNLRNLEKKKRFVVCVFLYSFCLREGASPSPHLLCFLPILCTLIIPLNLIATSWMLIRKQYHLCVHAKLLCNVGIFYRTYNFASLWRIGDCCKNTVYPVGSQIEANKIFIGQSYPILCPKGFSTYCVSSVLSHLFDLSSW